jgi:hypothetical protein
MLLAPDDHLCEVSQSLDETVFVFVVDINRSLENFLVGIPVRIHFDKESLYLGLTSGFLSCISVVKTLEALVDSSRCFAVAFESFSSSEGGEGQLFFLASFYVFDSSFVLCM